MNSSWLSCRQSVTTRRFFGVGHRQLQQVDGGLAAHQRLHQGAVEEHPAPVELGEAGREGAGDAQALVVEMGPAVLEAEGHEP